jgi:transposase
VPVCGVVGRDSGQVRLSVERHADSATLNRVVREASEPPARVNTDDWRGYDRLAETGHPRAVVCHTAGEWARDDDGDGVREVHNNTQEGLWTGLRNFLRPFRGVNKKYLYQYVAIFEWGYNIKRVTPEFIRAMLGVPITTFIPP